MKVTPSVHDRSNTKIGNTTRGYSPYGIRAYVDIAKAQALFQLDHSARF